jgi:uncharacterized membrane protein YphA (DoxX/SURF4 family)
MTKLRRWLSTPTDPSLAPLVLRLTVGFVFVASGAMKFLFANQGPGRFAHLGLPAPELLAHFVGAVELAGGALVLAGLLARPAALALVIDMAFAIALTKLPLLTGAGPEPVAAVPRTGLWAFAYQARLDVAMLVACAGVALAGAGARSVDAWLERRRALRGRARAPREVQDPPPVTTSVAARG